MAGLEFDVSEALSLVVQYPPATPYNLLPNADGGLGGFGFLTPVAGSAMRRDPFTQLTYDAAAGVANSFTTESVNVTAGQWVAARWVSTNGFTSGVLQWLDGNDVFVSDASATLTVAAGARTITPKQVPVGVERARLLVTVHQTSGGANPTTTLSYGFTSVAVAKAATSTIDMTALTPMQTIDLVKDGGGTEVKVTRSPLSGQLDVVLFSDTLDPAVEDIIRPGRRATLAANTSDPLFEGQLLDPQADYDPRRPEGKQARVSFSIVDAWAALGKQTRSEGVGTVDELRYVLEGCGVPWRVNGSTGQSPGAVVVSLNDNASAADQVVLTRDSRHAYAWVDVFGVLNVADADELDNIEQATINETVYRDIDITFDTPSCINEVVVKVLQVNPGTGESEELTFGPYRDLDSKDEWGPRRQEFTVHGDVDPATFAAEVLAANATPQVRVNSVTVPINTIARLTQMTQLVDLYQLVRVQNTGRGIDQVLRVTGIEHDVSPRRWMMTLHFTDGNRVATTVSTPSPSVAGGGKTLAELLRPVGEVTMFYGAPSAVPTGWLVCDGSSFSGTEFPKLQTLLGGTTLPNLVDRFPIGAGVKALGTSGGDPTKMLDDRNVPPFTVTATGSAGGGSADNGGDSVAQGGTTGRFSKALQINGGAPTLPLDVMPPWRALYFIIRAA